DVLDALEGVRNLLQAGDGVPAIVKGECKSVWVGEEQSFVFMELKMWHEPVVPDIFSKLPFQRTHKRIWVIGVSFVRLLTRKVAREPKQIQHRGEKHIILRTLLHDVVQGPLDGRVLPYTAAKNDAMMAAILHEDRTHVQEAVTAQMR